MRSSISETCAEQSAHGRPPHMKETILFHRVKNHVMRGQFDKAIESLRLTTTEMGTTQYTAGFIKGATNVIHDGRERLTSLLLVTLLEHPSLAQAIMPVQNEDPQLKGKLTMIFFAASKGAASLSKNCIKDFTPSIWDSLIAQPHLFNAFAHTLYKAVADRNDMLEKFHTATDSALFLNFCKRGKGDFCKPAVEATPDDIAQLIQDRAEFLDVFPVDLAKNDLVPTWLNIADSTKRWSDVYVGIHKAAEGSIPWHVNVDASNKLTKIAQREIGLL